MTGDKRIDAAIAQAQQGEKIDMKALEAELRKGTFELVVPGAD